MYCIGLPSSIKHIRLWPNDGPTIIQTLIPRFHAHYPQHSLHTYGAKIHIWIRNPMESKRMDLVEVSAIKMVLSVNKG